LIVLNALPFAFAAIFGRAISRDNVPLGISAHYVLTTFPSEASTATGMANPTFHDVCPVLACGPDGKGHDMKCPRDGLPDCSIVDAVDAEYRGRATHFVSWSWSYTVGEFVSAIECWLHDTGSDSKQTLLWVCFFCNTQYRVLNGGKRISPDELKAIFGQSLISIGRMLVMLNSFEEPVYVKRAWCLFECFTCIQSGVPMEVILPVNAQADFQRTITHGDGLQKLKEKFKCIDMRSAQASIKHDKDAIKKLILDGEGFDKVNSEVKQKLLDWITREFRKYILASVGPS